MVATVAQAVSAQTLFMALLAVIAGIALAKTPIGQMVYAVGGNERAARYAGINTGRVRFSALVFSALCSSFAGVIYVAYLRSFNPSAGIGRELDAISSVIIGGGSIFGGYGTIIGAIAGGGKGAAIGGVVGAGAGTAVQVSTKGDKVRIPSETLLEFKLQQDVTAPLPAPSN